ncbi:MAG: hypothetical protein FIB08_15690 [Candidatus Methanoperedens sp.]|nr:hypothetical protein [Candidatus Methanoperedens sp.]
MDCCGSSKPKENDKDAKIGQQASENNPVQKEQAHGGGCCGGGGKGMWLHLILMIIVFIAVSYITKG